MHLTTNTGYRTQTGPCVLVGSAFYDPVLFRWHFPGALVSCHLTYLANFYCFTLFIDCQQVILRWQSYMWPEQSQLKRYIYICSDTEYRTWPGRKKIELSWYFRVKVIIQKWHLHFNLDFCDMNILSGLHSVDVQRDFKRIAKRDVRKNSK